MTVIATVENLIAEVDIRPSRAPAAGRGNDKGWYSRFVFIVCGDQRDLAALKVAHIGVARSVVVVCRRDACCVWYSYHYSTAASRT